MLVETDREMTNKKKGYGIIDTVIDKLPEIHLPTYQYLGPGTKLEERLARGDPGKNELDVACKHHDIAYATCKDTASRSKADKILIGQALKRIYARDAKLDERAAALLVSVLMTAKLGLTKIGLGLNGKKMRNKGKKHTNRKSVKKSANLKKTSKVQNVKKSVKKSNQIIKAAIRKPQKTKRSTTRKRVLKVPKFGKSLQSILPGSITESAASLLKALKEIELAKKQLPKKNKTGKSVNGSGIYLKPANQSHH